MTINRLAIPCCILLATLLLSGSQIGAADLLSDVLRESKWDGIIGTWVDPETKGERHKSTYVWKIKDRVIAITSRQATVEHFSLMGVNGKTGDVFHMGVSNDGSSSLGKWKLDDNGDAVLQMVFTGGDGQEGALNVRHHLQDADTMIVTVELPQPIKWKLIRVEPKE